MARRLAATIRAFSPSPRALILPFLAVLVAALTASSAQAAVGPSLGPTLSVQKIAAGAEEGESEEEEEEEEEEEIEVELEFEEAEEGEEGALPAECRLRTATPRAVARFDQGDMRLTLRYTSDSALRVGVSYWLKGAKGTLRLGSTTRRIGRQGTIALSRHLDGRSLDKLHAARTIVVQVVVPNTPRSCRRHLTMRLSPVRPLGSGATWYAPASRKA